jgi:hypothetical protein
MTFPMDGKSPPAASASISIQPAAAHRYQVAGFAAGEFLAYVVSELKAKANLQSGDGPESTLLGQVTPLHK